MSIKYWIGGELLAITFHPERGQILICSFEQGFVEPEMVKSRPVVVISPRIRGRNGLVTVVPFSTAAPDPIQPYHMLLPKSCLPQLGKFQEKDSWLKGDMLYTVGFHRLDLIRLNQKRPDGKRQYFKNRLSRPMMEQVYQCVLHGIGMPHLADNV